MKRSPTVPLVATVFLFTAALSGCKQEAQSRNPKKVVAAMTKNKNQAVIARVVPDPQNSTMGKLELVASNQALSKNSSPQAIASAFSTGSLLGLKKEGMALSAMDSKSGQTFALYECPPGYHMPYSSQASQMAAYNQPNIGIDNIFSTFSNGGSGFFSSLLSGVTTGGGDGILESVSGTLQSLIGIFTGGNTGTVGVDPGQTVSNLPAYGCVPINGTAAPNYQWYPPPATNTATTVPTSATPTTATSTPTPYPYIGQVEYGPYTYYTYALPSSNQVPPATTQP